MYQHYFLWHKFDFHESLDLAPGIFSCSSSDLRCQSQLSAFVGWSCSFQSFQNLWLSVTHILWGVIYQPVGKWVSQTQWTLQPILIAAQRCHFVCSGLTDRKVREEQWQKFLYQSHSMRSNRRHQFLDNLDLLIDRFHRVLLSSGAKIWEELLGLHNEQLKIKN